MAVQPGLLGTWSETQKTGFLRTRLIFKWAAQPLRLARVWEFTVKFLNFGMPEILAVIYLKFKQRGQTLRVFCQNCANDYGIANSEDPGQTAPLGAV